VHQAAVEVGGASPDAQRLHDPDTLQPPPHLIQGQPCRPGGRTARKREFSGASGPLNVYLNPGLALDHGNLNRGLVVSTSDCTPPLTNPAPDEVQDDGQDKNADDPRERRRLSS
jgi:hypothetical protein